MEIPTKIIIKSDLNELTFKNILKQTNGKGGMQYVYEHTVSESKMGKALVLSEPELTKLISHNK